MTDNTCHVFCTLVRSELVRTEPRPQPLVLDPKTCPPAPLFEGHLCSGCWEGMSGELRFPLIKKVIIQFAFPEQDEEIIDVYRKLKAYFEERKIYAHEDPVEFARFWIRVYAKIKCRGLEWVVTDEGTPYVQSYQGRRGGGGGGGGGI